MYPLIAKFFSTPNELKGFCSSYLSEYIHNSKKTAFDYLMYAKKNLESGIPGKDINAISNIGRALFMELDMFLESYGLLEYCKAEKLTAMNKINLLNNLGLFPSRMIREVNKIRNIVEHEYKNIEYYNIKNSFEIVHVFALYIDRFIYGRPTDVEFSVKEDSKRSSVDGNLTLRAIEMFEYIENEKNEEEGGGIKLRRGKFKNIPGKIKIEGTIYNNDTDEECEIENEIISVYDEPDEFFFLLSIFINYNRLEMYNSNLFFRDVHFFNKLLRKYKF